MLTKDLARFRYYKGAIKPRLVDPADPELLQVAEELVAVFQDGVGASRDDIEEQTGAIIDGAPAEAVVSRGLEKLLMDRAEFLAPEDESLPELRADVFAKTSRALAEQTFESSDDYAAWVQTQFGKPLDALAETIYQDLPGSHPLTEFREITPVKLLDRYNVAQVQWLLLNANELHIHLPQSSAAQMRQLLKYLRFTQLLAEIRQDDGFHLKVDGPLNLFAQTKRYGMNLARFFPALLHQPAWSLRTDIKTAPRRQGQLTLDDSIGLRPEHERFTAYTPPEFDIFRKSLADKTDGWRADANNAFIPLPGEVLCFPDFTLRHESGLKIGVELFHPWHASHLPERLRQLEDAEAPPLILGVALPLTRDKLTASALADSAYYQNYGFTFRDLPTVTKVKPILKRLLA